MPILAQITRLCWATGRLLQMRVEESEHALPCLLARLGVVDIRALLIKKAVLPPHPGKKS